MHNVLTELGLTEDSFGAAAGGPLETHGAWLESFAPGDGSRIGRVRQATAEDYEQVMKRTIGAFAKWREMPAPKRGEIVREIGEQLRAKKKALGALVALEMGKIRAEGEGEVQEMIDIADFAVGLSRQIYGQVIASERAQHRLTEQWHPIGCVGIISAFNFPVAVWSWNAFLAAVCGDVMVWKPSFKTPLCAIAVQKIVDEVLAKHECQGVMSLVIGTNEEIGERMINDERIPLISATGSTRMGQHVAQVVAKRFGRSLLELGGNNALVVMDDANQKLALGAVLFGAVGTAGQRCTTTRRLLLQEGIAKEFTDKLVKAYEQVRIGNPLTEGTLMGPLIDKDAVASFTKAIEQAKAQGGEILRGGKVLTGDQYPGGCYVEPTIIRAKADMAIVREETFAPILYVMTFNTIDDAIHINNNVPQGLSSSVFTESMRTAERWVSAVGSDCGIANVNVGTSGAEIGGAFGGEKHTGGGREAGSDSWKAYMRRQTQTINWSTALPLAQGIQFL